LVNEFTVTVLEKGIIVLKTEKRKRVKSYNPGKKRSIQKREKRDHQGLDAEAEEANHKVGSEDAGAKHTGMGRREHEPQSARATMSMSKTGRVQE